MKKWNKMWYIFRFLTSSSPHAKGERDLCKKLMQLGIRNGQGSGLTEVMGLNFSRCTAVNFDEPASNPGRDTPIAETKTSWIQGTAGQL
jgi:hypothetical protein